MITFVELDGLRYACSDEIKAKSFAVERRLRNAKAVDHDGKAVDMRAVDIALDALEAPVQEIKEM